MVKKNLNKEVVFDRVMLKLSGEALLGDKEFGIDPVTVDNICRDISNVANEGTEVCIVVGGGNIFRGLAGTSQGVGRVTAIEKFGVSTRVLSAIPMQTICEPFIRRRAIRHLEKKRVVIFAAGTGNPYFTTDTAAALRAAEMNCSVIMKGTKVDGVYSSDPLNDDNAIKYGKISYSEVLARNLKVMDSSAISLARDNNIPIIIFSIKETNSFFSAIKGKIDISMITT